ncbi:MAG: hypothetical protein IR160_11420 [Salinibacterium sp.]|nr:hypothetical protein [Salinibacterium sp.]MBF0673181.1 hypothetical protein [Salinibacterium sp.]
MEWIATGVAVVAALIAGWQAWEARRSRLDARSSASEAEEHEERTVAASERIAAAVEEQNARARAAADLDRAERERYRTPWTIEPQAAASKAWKFLLGGNEQVTGVALRFARAHKGDRVNVNIPESGATQPGQSFRLDWWRGLQSSQQIDAHLHWTRPNGEQHSAAVTLD